MSPLPSRQQQQTVMFPMMIRRSIGPTKGSRKSVQKPSSNRSRRIPKSVKVAKKSKKSPNKKSPNRKSGKKSTIQKKKKLRGGSSSSGSCASVINQLTDQIPAVNWSATGNLGLVQLPQGHISQMSCAGTASTMANVPGNLLGHYSPLI